MAKRVSKKELININSHGVNELSKKDHLNNVTDPEDVNDPENYELLAMEYLPENTPTLSSMHKNLLVNAVQVILILIIIAICLFKLISQFLSII